MTSFRPSRLEPQASYRDYQRQRQLTLGDLLLENRIILLQGEIYDGNANEVVMKLLYLQSENRRKDDKIEGDVPGKAEVFARVPEAAAADVEAARLGNDGDDHEEHHQNR